MLVGLGVLLAGATSARATFSGSNGKIAYALGRDVYTDDQIWTIPAAGGTPTLLGDGASPAWSRTGTRLAFVRAGHIFVANANGTDPVQLTEGLPYDEAPTWSPDGSKLAYCRLNTDSQVHDVWTIDADGSDATHLYSSFGPGPACHPSWSPDGTKIAFHARSDSGSEPTYDIDVIDPDGNNFTVLLSQQGYVHLAPDWSPNGSSLVFFREDYIYFIGQLYEMGADGSNPTALTDCTTCGESAGDRDPTWSPDGTKIAFARSLDPSASDLSDLMVMDADGQNMHRLTGTDQQGFYIQDPAWQPVPPSDALASIRVRVSAPAHAGAPFTVTATALNFAGQKLTSYNGPATWSSSGGGLSPASPEDFVSGVSTTTATVSNPLHADRLMITSGRVTGVSDSFNVLGPLSAISVSVPATATATVPFAVQATATDSVGNFLTDYNGPATWSSLDGGLSPAAPTNFINGVSTTSATIPRRFTDDRITITSGGISGQSNAFTVIGPTTIAVTVKTPVFVGTPFTVKAVARDAAGKTLTAFSAAASWSDLSGQLSPAAPANFVNGVSTTQATVAIPFKGNKVTVTGGGVSGTSAAFGVAGPFAGITMTVVRPVTAGSPFTVLAQAVDSVGNFVKNYNAPATWSDLSGQLSPATPADFVNGVSRTSATVPSPFHADKITIASGGKVRQSGAFDVLGPLSSIAVTVPSSVTHGVPFSVKAVAKDAVGDTLSTYNQTATWSSISGGLSPAAPSAFKNGVSTTAATFATAFTNNRITVTSGGINGQSNLFNVL